MSLDKIIVTVAGAGAIVFIYWFFLMKKEKTVRASGEIEIVVDGGYTPASISIPKDAPTTLTFLRKDPSACLEEVVLADFKIKKFLPVNEKVSVTVTPRKAGTFSFSCGMNMFHGTLVVTSEETYL